MTGNSVMRLGFMKLQIARRESAACGRRNVDDQSLCASRRSDLCKRPRQRTHAGGAGRDQPLMQRLCPHFQRAYQMRARLTAVPGHANALEDALDLLADGVALLRRDGGIVYANEALRMLAARGNDFRVDRKVVEFSTIDLRNRFAAALNSAQRVEDPSVAFGLTDFAVPRDHGLPPYTVSVRPLTRARMEETHNPDAVAMLLIHDP